MNSTTEVVKKPGLFVRFLNLVERAGNKMCHPLTLFCIITLIILLCSLIFGSMGVTVTNPVSGEEVAVVNLLNGEGLARMLGEFASNVNNFPPLVLVLTIMFGVGLAESTGLAEAVMKVSVLKAPKWLVVPIILFIGINANAAGDAGFILMPIVGSMVFLALGKHPIAGMTLGYASVAAGFSASMLVGTTDLLIVGFTQPAAEMVDASYQASPLMNWFFMFASTLFLLPVGTFVNNRFVEKRLGKYTGAVEEAKPIEPEQRRGLRWAGIALLVTVILIVLVTLPPGAPLRSSEDGGILSMTAPFMLGIVPIIAILFFVPSLFYGLGIGLFKNDKDVCDHIGKAMASMGSYVAFCIIAAQMIAYFSWTNLGPVVAIAGASFLSSINLTGIPLFILFILLCALINLLIASNSAKWALLAPVFIPMFMLLGYDPALTQCAYRIGDSCTNAVTPMMAYFAILVSLAQKYDKKAGMGSLMSCLLPYTLTFLVCWTLFFIVWYLLGIPFGPGYGAHL